MKAASGRDAVPVWVDGRLLPAARAALELGDSAYAEGRGCFTSVRIAGGAPRFAARHLRRLARDAQALGLPAPDAGLLARGLAELAREAFGAGDGIVRIQLSQRADGGLRATARARPLGDDAPVWRAATAPQPHPGPGGGHKLTARGPWARAETAARAAGAHEALLFDAAGRLVEGARTNLVVLDAGGILCTPPPERGAVAGVALAIVREREPALRHRDLSSRGLLAARGVVALNAVRGARALGHLDGQSLGAEGPALAGRLDALLAGEA